MADDRPNRQQEINFDPLNLNWDIFGRGEEEGAEWTVEK